MENLHHPGNVEYFENRHGKETLVQTEKITNPKDTSHFFKGSDGWVPVVKVVAIMDDDGFPKEIIEYGPHGERLRSSYTQLN